MKSTLKALVILFLSLSTLNLSAKDFTPYIQHIEVNDRMLKGKVGQYPITMYLAFQEYSNYSVMAYSVKGWYSYDSKGEHIPLCGMVYGDNITLYQFNDIQKVNEMLSFSTMKNFHREDMEYYQNLEGYVEKFTIGSSSKWTNGSKTFDVEMRTDDFQIRKSYDFLYLDSNQVFDLALLGGWRMDYTVVASNENRVVLQYERPSTPNAMGFCGAGFEKGLTKIVFNKNWEFVDSEMYRIESCVMSIDYEMREIDDAVLEYECQNYSAGTTYRVLLNTQLATVKESIDSE